MNNYNTTCNAHDKQNTACSECMKYALYDARQEIINLQETNTSFAALLERCAELFMNHFKQVDFAEKIVNTLKKYNFKTVISCDEKKDDQ